MNETRCKEEVWTRDRGWFQHSQCRNKAVTEAGYCKVHDPELKKQREAAKPPSKWERQVAARKLLDEWLSTKLSTKDAATARRLIHWARDDRSDPPHPLPTLEGLLNQ